ncbi:class I SAM-dependent methyltransferase, partial [Oligoflexia bacterium]|nr:class I SAM-dependent methyltransferase [Oligoflexia bacterium]
SGKLKCDDYTRRTAMGYEDAWAVVPEDTPGKIHRNNFGSENYNILRNLLVWCSIVKLQRGAEIGTFLGDTSFHLLAEISALTLFSIDPWDKYEGYKEYNGEILCANEQKARARLKCFGERSVIIKDFSVSAAEQFETESLDFVFIDGNHSYDFVKEDIRAWYPKVRPGGLFSGHDYHWEGVQRAVHEFSAERSLAGSCSAATSDVWYFIKPE